MAHIDYKNDLLKHYVRKFGWLPACQNQRAVLKRHFDKMPLRYFTFCAAEAIDVFMLVRERILKRSEKTGRLEGVFFCEKDPKSFADIAALIGSPEQGFLGEFDKIVLFEDDEDTKGKSIVDKHYDEAIRQKLKYKDANDRLYKAFPFDIINLDVCGVMFPLRQGVLTPLLKSIIKILQWQTELNFPNGRDCQQFTLFLTSHIDPDLTDEAAVKQLENRLAENISSIANFQLAFRDRYNHQEAGQLAKDNFAEFFSLALAKFIIHRALFDLGWDVVYEPTYLYNRDNIYGAGRQYQMMHSVSVYKRIPNFRQRLDDPILTKYTQIATQIIDEGVIWADPLVEQPDIKRELEDDLGSIVEYRDESKAG